MSKRVLWSLVIIVVCVVLDQWTKVLAVEHLKGEPSIKIIGDYFFLTFAYNKGAFLGMGDQLSGFFRQLILVIIPLAAVIGGYVFVLKKTALSKIEFTSINLLIAGGIGNIIDRIFNEGRVVDFMVFDSKIWIIRTGVVNIADIVITVGVVILLVDSFAQKKEEPNT